MANGNEVKVFEWRFGPASVVGLIQLVVLIYGIWWVGSFLKQNFEMLHQTVGVVKTLSEQMQAHEKRLNTLESAAIVDYSGGTRR